MKFIKADEYRLLLRATAERIPLSPLKRKLRGFGALPVGWSHGEGVSVAAEAVRVAEYFVDIASQLQLKADVFPGLHGDCAVTFYQGQRSVEVIVDAQHLDSFGFHVEHGSGFQFETIEEKNNASYAEVVGRIVQLVPEAWKSPAYSRFVSLTGTSADFQMSSSSTLQEWPLAHLMGS